MYSSALPQINDLVQKSLEYGFIRFYDRMESFFRELNHKPSMENQQLQSEAIVMNNIWIYVEIFLAASCFNIAVFACEILIFNRKKILSPLIQAMGACQKVIKSFWSHLLTKISIIVRSTRDLAFERN